jgi:hypothetical protein
MSAREGEVQNIPPHQFGLGPEFETPTEVGFRPFPSDTGGGGGGGGGGGTGGGGGGGGGTGGGGGGGGLTDDEATAIVTGWYHDTLTREPDADGLAVWLDALVRRRLAVNAVHLWFLDAAKQEIDARG